MYRHPVTTDKLLQLTLHRANSWCKTTRFLPESSEPKSLLRMSLRYAAWLATMGVSKKFAKWVLPITTSSEPLNRAQRVFGKDPSPIAVLGDIPVAAYIRFLLFDQEWSVDAVCKHLVDEHGYSYKSARPSICRIVREKKANRVLFSKEALFTEVIYG